MNHRLALLGLAMLAAGCVSPSPAPTLRWFAPPVPVTAPSVFPKPLPLRRVAVRASAHLDEHMLLRTSDVEYFPGDVDRWISPPAAFVEQALADALFGSGRCVESADGAELRVLVREFEAVLDESSAVVALELALETSTAIHRTTLRTAVPFDDATAPSIARAIGRALGACGVNAGEWLATLGL